MCPRRRPELYTVVFSGVVVYRGPSRTSNKAIYHTYLRSADGRTRRKDADGGTRTDGTEDAGLERRRQSRMAWGASTSAADRRHQGSVRGGGGGGGGGSGHSTGLVDWFLNRASDALSPCSRCGGAAAAAGRRTRASRRPNSLPPLTGGVRTMHSVLG